MINIEKIIETKDYKLELDNLIKQTKNIQPLFIEDHKESREAILSILDVLFDNIIVAVDGKDGLEKFKNNDIDMIITDIEMPKMDGLELCKQIKQIDNNQSIIVLTATTNRKIIQEAIDIGIDSFINKPIEDINILFHKIEQCLKK